MSTLENQSINTADSTIRPQQKRQLISRINTVWVYGLLIVCLFVIFYQHDLLQVLKKSQREMSVQEKTAQRQQGPTPSPDVLPSLLNTITADIGGTTIKVAIDRQGYNTVEEIPGTNRLSLEQKSFVFSILSAYMTNKSESFWFDRTSHTVFIQSSHDIGGYSASEIKSISSDTLDPENHTVKLLANYMDKTIDTMINSGSRIQGYNPATKELVMSTGGGDSCAGGGTMWALAENGSSRTLLKYSAGCSHRAGAAQKLLEDTNGLYFAVLDESDIDYTIEANYEPISLRRVESFTQLKRDGTLTSYKPELLSQLFIAHDDYIQLEGGGVSFVSVNEQTKKIENVYRFNPTTVELTMVSAINCQELPDACLTIKAAEKQ